MIGDSNFRSISMFNSDYLGAAASSLCIIHCLLTPMLFVVQVTGSLSCAEISPIWWRAIDYLFLLVTFVAIRATTRSTTSRWISLGLYLSWTMLALIIANETAHLYPLPHMAKYIPAIFLICLHVYNLMYCRCDDDVATVTNNPA